MHCAAATWPAGVPNNVDFCSILHQPLFKLVPITFPHLVWNISFLSIISNWLERFTEQFTILIYNSFFPPAPQSWISSTCFLCRSRDLSRSTEMNYKPIFLAWFELPAWRLVSIKMNKSISRKWIFIFLAMPSCAYAVLSIHQFSFSPNKTIRSSTLSLSRIKQNC